MWKALSCLNMSEAMAGNWSEAMVEHLTDAIIEDLTKARRTMCNIRVLYENVRDAFIADPSDHHQRCERKVYSKLVASTRYYHSIACRQFAHHFCLEEKDVLWCCCPECAQGLPQCSQLGCTRQAIWACPCHGGLHMCGYECARELLQGGHMESCVAYRTVTLCALRDVDVYTVNPHMSCYELCLMANPYLEHAELPLAQRDMEDLSMRDERRISESHVVAQRLVYDNNNSEMQYACSAGGCMQLATIFCACGSVAYCSDLCREAYVSEHGVNCPDEHLHDDFSIVSHNGAYVFRYIWNSELSDGAKRLLCRDPLVGSRVSGYRLAMMDLYNLSPECAAYFAHPGKDMGLAGLHRCILQQKLMGHRECASRLFVRSGDLQGGLTEQAHDRLCLFAHGYPHTSCMLAGCGLNGCRADQVQAIWRLFAQFMLLPLYGGGNTNFTMQGLAQCEARLVEVYEIEYGGL